MSDFDVVIIGAGAAGLMTAGRAVARGLKTAVIEHTAEIGEKIRISGGGRCNFTNIHCAPDRFISENPHFCKSAFSRFTPFDFIELVKKHNIAFHEKTLGQLFCDDSAQQIIDMLLAECKGADIRRNTSVTHIEKIGEEFELETSGGIVTCRKLVIATGGLSIPKIGASKFAYDIAAQFDLKMVAPRAALVPLTFDVDVLARIKPLSGVAIDPAVVSAQDGTSFREALLFTHRGLSGPSILQISSYWNAGEDIFVNLCPDLDMPKLLKDMRAAGVRKKLHNLLAEIMPSRLADMIAGTLNLQDHWVTDLSDEKIKAVATHIHNWRVHPNGSEGYRTAEVTRGGISTDEVSSKTFEVKKVSGLYIVGEALDVTGWLGGYNFQWAWSSGWCCGESL